MAFKFNPFTKRLDYYPKLDDCAVPDDNIDLDASTSKHGLLLKLGGGTSNFLRADGTWNVPPVLAHAHDGGTLQLDSINSDGGAFAFTTSGAVTFNQAIVAATASTIGDTQIHSEKIDINVDGSGNRYAYLNLVGDDTYTEYGFRMIRQNGGANAYTDLIHRGTGALRITTFDAGAIFFNTTNATRVAIAADGALVVYHTLQLASGAVINEFSTDGTLGGNSDNAVPTEKAVKAYADVIGSLALTHASRHQNTGGDEINVGGLSGELADNQPPKAHIHDGDTLQLDSINSNGGAFAFTTTGAVTFNQALTVNNNLILGHGAVRTLAIGGDDTHYGYITWHRATGNARGAYMGYGTPQTRLELVLEDGNYFYIAGGDVQLAGDLRVDGGQIGITADPDLISMAADTLTINGNIFIEKTAPFLYLKGADGQACVATWRHTTRDATHPQWTWALSSNNVDFYCQEYDGTTWTTWLNFDHADDRIELNKNVIMSGEVTMPAQPAFQVKLSGSQTDIAVASDVTVLFNTETYDQGNDFNTGTYTFTAPVTGIYHFDVSISLQNLDAAANYYYIDVVTSNGYYRNIMSPASMTADVTNWTLNISVDADMDANDTAYVRIYHSHGTQQTDIISTYTFFTGRLVA